MSRAAVLIALVCLVFCGGGPTPFAPSCLAQEIEDDLPPGPMGGDDEDDLPPGPMGGDDEPADVRPSVGGNLGNVASLRVHFGQRTDVALPADRDRLSDPITLRVFNGRRLYAEQKISTGKDWKAAASQGMEFRLTRIVKESETQHLEIRIEAAEDHSLWDDRVIVIGIASDGVEWVLQTQQTNRVFSLTTTSGVIPRSTGDQLGQMILKLVEYSGPEEVTAEIRLVGSEPTENAVVHRMVISEKWQWQVFKNEGILMIWPERRRVIPEAATEQFELVVYSGRPTQPADKKIERATVQVTGFAHDDETLDDNVQSFLVDNSSGLCRRSPLYWDYSKVHELFWQFHKVTPNVSE